MHSIGHEHPERDLCSSSGTNQKTIERTEKDHQRSNSVASWAGKTSDRQSTVVQMLLPVNDIGIKAFLFFKLIILMELQSNRFECLWQCSVTTRRQSASEGQGPIEVLDCWDTDLLQIKFDQRSFEEDSLLFLVTAANEPQSIVISLLHQPYSSRKKYRTLSKTRRRRESHLLPPTDNEIRTIAIEWSVSNACAALNWLCLMHRTLHIRRRVFGHFRSLAQLQRRVINQWDNDEVVFSISRRVFTFNDPIIEHIDLPPIGLAGLITRPLKLLPDLRFHSNSTSAMSFNRRERNVSRWWTNTRTDSILADHWIDFLLI